MAVSSSEAGYCSFNFVLMDLLYYLSSEENVYFLCKKLCANGVADADGSDLYVLLITEEQIIVEILRDASKRADGVILWDYHVVCIQRKRGGDSPCLVWDLDSSLPFPSPLASYVSETIRPSFQLFSEYQRFFRIVHAPIFLRFFASDRRHMKDPAGNWIAKPPSYEPMVAEDKTVHNLNEFIEIRAKDIPTNIGAELINDVSNKKLGVVMNKNQLEEFFSQVSR
ncbi:hypothetical protein EZV62_028300 [Acer yangbiense]|uniref:Protein N-terminal glutamine amidohydrolase n=1 Tax=Acer yangbiense TaxID=1000413 RepID=A0A5C7GNW7_9ROSI|nr:hypothetical protein EZV62_028300 [Acer yangbiense]